MRSEYDFSRAVRGKYYRRYVESSNVVVIDPDVHEKFGNAAPVAAPGRAVTLDGGMTVKMIYKE
jgi:hypothetical protein